MAENKKLILLTNDDGITAPGLVAMYRHLTSKVEVENAFTGTAVAGSPADCVKLAISQLLPRQPDLVISGINSGANVGINVIYSGTVAAAIEAAFLGLPAIALSLYLKRDVPPDYARTAELSRKCIEQILAAGLRGGQVASVNIPSLRPNEKPAGLKVVRQCTRPWNDTYERRKDPRGRDYFWNSSVFTLSTTEPDTDVAALRENFITITPLQFDLTEHGLLREWMKRGW